MINNTSIIFVYFNGFNVVAKISWLSLNPFPENKGQNKTEYPAQSNNKGPNNIHSLSLSSNWTLALVH